MPSGDFSVEFPPKKILYFGIYQTWATEPENSLPFLFWGPWGCGSNLQIALLRPANWLHWPAWVSGIFVRQASSRLQNYNFVICICSLLLPGCPKAKTKFIFSQQHILSNCSQWNIFWKFYAKMPRWRPPENIITVTDKTWWTCSMQLATWKPQPYNPFF